MKPNIAIIGGNGFIGKNFTKYFSERDFQVLCMDHNIKDNISKNKNIIPISVDIHHTMELIESLKDAEIVIWLVHASVPSTKDESLVDDFLLNVAPIVKFLEKANHLPNLKKFIYLSSGGTVYGDTSTKTPIPEDTIQKPISNYGLSKSVAEKYIEYLTRNSPFESIIFRPSNVYGPYQNLIKPQGIIGFAFRAIRDQKTLDLYNEGRVIRDFIYVKDVAEAVEKALKENSNEGKTSIYNLGSNEGFTIKEIIRRIEEISNKKLVINNKSSRSFDCEYNVLDTKKIEKTLNWKKSTEIDDGLRNVWEWINNNNKT